MKKMIEKYKIPCKDCLVIPLCKGKNYGKLLNECRLLNDVLYHPGRLRVTSIRKEHFDIKLYIVDKLLGSSHWLNVLYRYERDSSVERLEKLEERRWP